MKKPAMKPDTDCAVSSARSCGLRRASDGRASRLSADWQGDYTRLAVEVHMRMSRYVRESVGAMPRGVSAPPRSFLASNYTRLEAA